LINALVAAMANGGLPASSLAKALASSIKSSAFVTSPPIQCSLRF
jgi:hypothetical protein